MLTTTEYGKIHHMSRPTVIAHLKTGKIKGHEVENKWGRKEWRIPETEIENGACPKCGYSCPNKTTVDTDKKGSG